MQCRSVVLRMEITFVTSFHCFLTRRQRDNDGPLFALCFVFLQHFLKLSRIVLFSSTKTKTKSVRRQPFFTGKNYMETK